MVKFLGLLFIFSLSLAAYARKPAVDDFVGIPSETEHMPSQGKELEFLFNFQKDVAHHQKLKTPETDYLGFRFSYLIYSFAIFSLPFACWFFFINYFDKKEAKEKMDNLILIEKYKKSERAQKNKDQNKAA